MTITHVSRHLTLNALRRLTSGASLPGVATLDIEQWSRHPGYLSLSAIDAGSAFHDALKGFLGSEELPYEHRKLYPFLNTIRGHLRELGFNDFKTEAQVGNGHVHGRADILATGPGGSAAIELKTVRVLPDRPKPKHVVQGGMAGFLSENGHERQGLILIYVDLRGKRIRSFTWESCRAACFCPWELKRAA
jgi:hypothetical protein